MDTAIICAVGIVILYIMLYAVVKDWSIAEKLYSARIAISIVLGALIAIPISANLFFSSGNMKGGILTFCISIAAIYGVTFLIENIVDLEKIKKTLKKILDVLLKVVLILAIITVIYLILNKYLNS